eukprot:scaffold118428_cov63-Phaeocystis_antarctica.AAC.2
MPARIIRHGGSRCARRPTDALDVLQAETELCEGSLVPVEQQHVIPRERESFVREGCAHHWGEEPSWLRRLAGSGPRRG